MNCPTTLEEAKTFRYCRWGGCPDGTPWRKNQCAMDVHDIGRGALSHQCSRNSGHGPDGLFCSQHAAELSTDTKTWFSVKYDNTIEQIQVTKSSKEFIWIKTFDSSRKEKVRNTYRVSFPTFREAQDYLIESLENKITSTLVTLEELRSDLVKVKSLSESTKTPSLAQERRRLNQTV